ncbi:MAG: transporter substrate-binding domain-containing protein [Methyloligellaceae bacterium]
MLRGALALCLAAVWLCCAPIPVFAQETDDAASNEEAKGVQKPPPNLKDVERITFLTDSDYPPFNYIDEEGALTGFNVDLARSICDELAVECDVRPVDWTGLVTSLERQEADAAIASLRVSKQTLEQLDFTESYYHTPARFVARKDSPLKNVRPEALDKKRIGVVKNTAHEAFVRDFYPTVEIVPFERLAKAQAALKARTIDLVFADGITLMFWLNGTSSEGCCEFRGGPYLESRYFGEGVGIAVRKGNRKIREILNYGLGRVRASGRYEELFLRYFPLSFF